MVAEQRALPAVFARQTAGILIGVVARAIHERQNANEEQSIHEVRTKEDVF